MINRSRTHEFSCRECEIRQRCIDSKGFGPGLRTSILRRFENRTDTFETWDMLQEDCILARRARPGETREPHQVTRLLQRLNQAKNPGQEPVPPIQERADRRIDYAAKSPAAPVWSSTPERVPCGLTFLASQRFARLPGQGDVVLGRFVPGFSNPPDIDLTMEDGEIPSVSRRHALVIGSERQHWIEDMGSANGTYINGHQLPVGKSVQLSLGDRLLLGRCRLAYGSLPKWVLEPDIRTAHTFVLVVTHNNHHFELSHKSEIIVGRPDKSVGFVPDADVSVAGDVSNCVSRRHITILACNGSHFLQEAGSAAGTRLNGKPIEVGDPPVMLRHGDQLWLGGCVLAYEWRPLKEESKQ